MSTGTHRCRCREETCKLVRIKPLPNNSTFKKQTKTDQSTVPGCVITSVLIAFPTQSFSSHCFHSRPTVYDLSFVFFYPTPPNNAPQSVPRLYTGNGQVKTLITYSTSLVLDATCSTSHSGICHLYSLCMTLSPCGILW